MTITLFLGPVIGGALGYLYFKVIGCKTGSCPITSNPIRSIAYGALMGYFFSR